MVSMLTALCVTFYVSMSFATHNLILIAHHNTQSLFSEASTLQGGQRSYIGHGKI